LRALAESEPKPLTENYAVKEAITAGEMVNKNTLAKLIENQLNFMKDKRGIIIDGYPREMDQVHEFEEKVSEKKKTRIK
jgi:adenylate kinase family enzyme